MPDYPNVSEIRKRIELVRDVSYGDDSVLGSFLREALKVCDEAEKNREGLTWKDPRAFLDLEFQAQLRFIEKVLNG